MKRYEDIFKYRQRFINKNKGVIKILVGISILRVGLPKPHNQTIGWIWVKGGWCFFQFSGWKYQWRRVLVEHRPFCPACKSEPPPRRAAATYACVQGGRSPPKNGTGQNYWLESSDSGICITSPVNLFTNSPLILVKSSSSPLVLSKWNGASLSVRAGPMIWTPIRALAMFVLR